MRLGEIKNILDKVIDGNSQIVISSEQIFGGQAYTVNNFHEIVEVYDVIKDFKWNDVDASLVDPIFTEHKGEPNPVQLEQTEFSTVQTYISEVNKKLLYFYSILSQMVETQDEKAINIKLPEDVDTFDDLNELNKRFQKTLGFFNIDGEFEFKEFDKGSDWYVVCTQGILSSAFFISCLKVGQEILKLRAEYFKSEEARISLEVAKKSNSKLTEEAFQKEWIEAFLESKVKEIIKEIGETNGAAEAELQTKLVKGVTSLVKELGEDVEFHLSLNPPEYVNETKSGLEISYKKIRQIREEEKKKLEDKKPKVLEEPKAKPPEDSKEKE